MRHEHLVVTVEAGIKERIDDDLGPGESLESWVADAIERKLAAEEAERPDARRVGGEGSTAESETTRRGRDGRFGLRSGDGRTGSESEADGAETGNGGDGEAETDGDDSFESGGDGSYHEGFEYVDDCSI